MIVLVGLSQAFGDPVENEWREQEAAKVKGELRLEDTGLPQQVELFRWIAQRKGEPPPVIDARDVQQRPAEVLRELCGRLGIGYSDVFGNNYVTGFPNTP